MKIVRTVLGDIAPEQLGFTDAHEHLMMDKDYILKLNPDYRLDSVEKTAAEVSSFMAAGGRAAVEMTCLGVGRNAKKLVEVARRTGFHIIASTGFHRPQFYIESHYNPCAKEDGSFLPTLLLNVSFLAPHSTFP